MYDLSHPHLQGVGHFTIYDDSSEDDPWTVLRKYAGLGIVKFVDMRGRPDAGSFKLQKNNLNTCFTDLRARYAELGLRRLIFPDVDEFVLSSNKGQSLTDLLNENYKGEACMEIGRTYYGTSLHHRRPSGLVTETYLLASPDYADGYPKMMANIYPEDRSDKMQRPCTQCTTSTIKKKSLAASKKVFGISASITT